jgi:hypothetical protein
MRQILGNLSTKASVAHHCALMGPSVRSQLTCFSPNQLKSEVCVLCSQSFCNNDRDTHKDRYLDIDFTLNAVVLKFNRDRLLYLNLMSFVVLLHAKFKAVVLYFIYNFNSLCKDNHILKIVSIFVFRWTQPE